MMTAVLLMLLFNANKLSRLIGHADHPALTINFQ